MANAFKRTTVDNKGRTKGKVRHYWVFPYSTSLPVENVKDARQAQRIAAEIERWHAFMLLRTKEPYQSGLHDHSDAALFHTLIARLERKLFPSAFKKKQNIKELSKWDIDRAKLSAGVCDLSVQTIGYLWNTILRTLPPHCVYPEDITSAVIEDYVLDRRKAGVRLQTLQAKELPAIKRILDRAYRLELIKALPIFPNKVLIRAIDRDPAHEGDNIPDEDIIAVFSQLRTDQLDFAVFILETGLRLYELSKVQFSWIVDKKLKLPSEATKTREPRDIALTEVAFRIAQKRFLIHGDYIFNEALKMTWAMERASKAAKLDYVVTCRDLRHTFASRQTNKGVPLTTVMAAMGHTSLSMTQKYIHASNSEKDKVLVGWESSENVMKISGLETQVPKKTGAIPDVVELKRLDDGFDLFHKQQNPQSIPTTKAIPQINTASENTAYSGENDENSLQKKEVLFPEPIELGDLLSSASKGGEHE